jgi:hypothetical protein
MAEKRYCSDFRNQITEHFDWEEDLNGKGFTCRKCVNIRMNNTPMIYFIIIVTEVK